MEENKNTENIENSMFEANDASNEAIENDIKDGAMETGDISLNGEENFKDIKEEKEETQETIEENEKPILQESPKKDIDSNEDNSLITVRPVKFPEFQEETTNRQIKKNLDILQDISMHISVEIGRTHSTIREVMDLEQGSIVELDKIAGEQVEVYANNKLVARGEVIVIEDKFGVRVTTTNIPKQNDSE